ncbi:hypothetical protein BGHDH14_bgh00950 [Blumeria hordei DH14]|uniref:Uncharacterized protein n=1 Tax=Blumeria graminis f. sp. hordei (strain DH14) TaxID=546991 RepID=N1JDF3_BLUG1|nr:hypothetical protein BGHDH14_bgh00950 [Blumeria hordei DH14]
MIKRCLAFAQILCVITGINTSARAVQQVYGMETPLDNTESNNSLPIPSPESPVVFGQPFPSITTVSFKFSRYGKIAIGGRTTIIKLSTGKLAVFSPGTLTHDVEEKIQSLVPECSHVKDCGPIGYLIAPDLEHHLYLSAWTTAFPNAHVIGMRNLVSKRNNQRILDPSLTHIHWHTIFTAENKQSISISPELDQDFDYEFVDGHKNEELVFFHKVTKTLIEADLLFNLPAKEQYSGIELKSPNKLTKFANKMLSTTGAARGQKFMVRFAFTKDRSSYKKSIKRIGSWDFQNIIPCHGEIIFQNGKEIFQKVYAGYLK